MQKLQFKRVKNSSSSTNAITITSSIVLLREHVRGVAGVALATPFFQDLFYMAYGLLAIPSSGLLAIWSSGHPAI